MQSPCLGARLEGVISVRRAVTEATSAKRMVKAVGFMVVGFEAVADGVGWCLRWRENWKEEDMEQRSGTRTLELLFSMGPCTVSVIRSLHLIESA